VSAGVAFSHDLTYIDPAMPIATAANISLKRFDLGDEPELIRF
jgi:hypothetical protein